jgi:hypothetical protein
MRSGLLDSSREKESSRFFQCFIKSIGGATGGARSKCQCLAVMRLSAWFRLLRSAKRYFEHQVCSDSWEVKDGEPRFRMNRSRVSAQR